MSSWQYRKFCVVTASLTPPTGSHSWIRRRYSAVRRSCSANVTAATPRQPMPRSAASSSVPGVVTVTHSGGCGSCTGVGSTRRSGIRQPMPSWANGSPDHILGSTCTYSSHVCLVRSGSTSKPPSSVHVDDRAVPTLEPPAGEDVERGGPLGDAHRVVHLRDAHDGAVADPDPLGAGGDRGQEHLRRRAVAVALEEVVLDRPHPVEAELVGEDRLLEGVLVHEALAVAVERRGHGELEEDAEAHEPQLRPPPGAPTGRAGRRRSGWAA